MEDALIEFPGAILLRRRLDAKVSATLLSSNPSCTHISICMVQVLGSHCELETLNPKTLNPQILNP